MADVPQPTDDNTIALESRKFCAFGVQNNINMVPVDEDEDELFNAFHRILNDNDILRLVPQRYQPDVKEPQVLDCGYGTGIWGEELMDLDENTDSVVTGIDIFIRHKPGLLDVYPGRWNLNAPLKDAPDEYWLDNNRFHLINSRFLVDGINKERWKPLIEEYRERLKHQGWLQMAEVQWIFYSRSNHALPALTQWSDAFYEALRRMDKMPDIACELEKFVRFNGGFQRVVSTTHDVPIGQWRQDDERDEVPITMLRYVHAILSSFAIVPFTQVLEWDAQRCSEVVQAAQAELKTRNANIYFRLTVVYGQKP